MDEARARRLVELYADMILRISQNYLKNTADAEDICQSVFLKYLSFVDGGGAFASDRHEKAWIIRTTINACKDHLRSAAFRRTVRLEEDILDGKGIRSEIATDTLDPSLGGGSEVLDAMYKLPRKYRMSLYLYYYEGYSAREIGIMVNRSEDTVATWLSRGRRRLKILLEASSNDNGLAARAVV